jgi:hypothetical protein
LIKDQSYQALFPKPVVVIDAFAEVSFFADVAQVAQKMFVCFLLVYFVDDLGSRSVILS